MYKKMLDYASFYTVNIWNPGLAVALFLALFPSVILFLSGSILKCYLQHNIDWEHVELKQGGQVDLAQHPAVSSNV